jgi:hypothetical protein
VAQVADELMLNAIFNAPVDRRAGAPKYRGLQQAGELTLEADEHVELRYACDGRYFAISVADRFGGLRRSDIVSFVGTALRGERRRAAIHDRRGAGLGLFMALTNVTQLVFNLAPGVRTEVIALLYIREGVRGLQSRGKSLNIFSTHGGKTPHVATRES